MEEAEDEEEARERAEESAGRISFACVCVPLSARSCEKMTDVSSYRYMFIRELIGGASSSDTSFSPQVPNFF